MAEISQKLAAPTRTLGGRIAFTVGIPALIVALAGVYLARETSLKAAREQAVERAALLSELVMGSFMEPAVAGLTPHAAVADMVQGDSELFRHVLDVRVVDTAGTVRWSRTPAEVGQRLPGFDRSMLLGASHSHDGRTYVRPVGGPSCANCHAADPQHLGAIQLDLEPPRQISEVDDIYRTALGGLIFLGLLFLAALSWALSRYVTKPMGRLAEAMDKARQGDFLVRVPLEADDEVGQLARGFNALLARITDLRAAEIETGIDMERMHGELALKTQLEQANGRLTATIRELRLLFELTRTIGSTLELDALLNLMCEMVGTALGFEEFSVMLLDEATGDLVGKAGFGPEHVPSDSRFKKGEGAAGRCAESGELVYIEDVEKDPVFVRHRGEKGSLLTVPMVFKDEMVGVLNFRRAQVHGFGPDETRFLQSVANQAAMAIVNARLHQKTVELSLTDSLTNTFNRRHLFSRLEHEVHRGQRFNNPVTTVMIDIDHFKRLNDVNGHSAGDRVLKAVAELLQAQVRKVDVLARYGGEEFFVILPQVTKSEGVEAGEKLRRAVERTAFPEGQGQPGGKVTISVGVASFPGDATTVDSLVDAVDSALYASKRGGRNKVSAFEPGMQDHPGRERGPKAKQSQTQVSASKSPTDGKSEVTDPDLPADYGLHATGKSGDREP